MKKRVAISCHDKYLRQKIRLILKDTAEILDASDAYGDADVLIINTNEKEVPRGVSCRVITLGDGGELALPFRHEELIACLDGDGRTECPMLVLGDKCASLRDKIIRFTDVEFSLLSVLADAKGEFVGREELLHRVWGGGVDGGILNVYVHYLREKLECGGEKIILSSRKRGYKIDEKYLTAKGDE